MGRSQPDASEERNEQIEQRYQRTEKLGEGTYGVVFMAKDLTTDKIVALKRVKLDSAHEGVPATAIREISVLKELAHPNIVDMLNVSCEQKSIYIVFEFLDQDLRMYIKANHPVQSENIRSILYQGITGLEYCHAHRIIHRDLKPQNMLVSLCPGHAPLVKLADFGLARPFNPTLRVYTHEVVTMWYRAPEVLLGVAKYTVAIDVWSMGCIFHESAEKDPLLPGDCEIDTLFRIFQYFGTPTPETWPDVTNLPEWNPKFPKWNGRQSFGKLQERVGPEGVNIFMQMMWFDPLDRPSARRLLTHKYFKGLDVAELYRPHLANLRESARETAAMTICASLNS